MLTLNKTMHVNRTNLTQAGLSQPQRAVRRTSLMANDIYAGRRPVNPRGEPSRKKADPTLEMQAAISPRKAAPKKAKAAPQKIPPHPTPKEPDNDGPTVPTKTVPATPHCDTSAQEQVFGRAWEAAADVANLARWYFGPLVEAQRFYADTARLARESLVAAAQEALAELGRKVSPPPCDSDEAATKPSQRKRSKDTKK